MEPVATADAGRDRAWHRFVLGIVLRGLRTVAGYALGGLVLFVLAAVVVERTLVDDDSAVPFVLLAVLYVVLGVAAGVGVGLALVLRRSAAAIARRASGLVGPVVERAAGRLAVPKHGVAPDRLRRLAELEIVTRRRRRLSRALASFAVRRAVEEAGLTVLRQRLLGLADQAESLGHPTVGRELIEAAARDGLLAAVGRQLDVRWRASAAVVFLASAVALLSLPVLAALVF